MAGNRVKSKNLFNFRPQGVIDEDVVAFDEKMKEDYGLDPEKMEAEMIGQTSQEFANGMRAMMDGILVHSSFGMDAAYVEVNIKISQMDAGMTMIFQAYAACDNTELEVATSHDGQYKVKVLVHTPKVRLGPVTMTLLLSSWLVRASGRPSCTPTAEGWSAARPTCTACSLPTWPSTAASSSTTWTTALLRRPSNIALPDRLTPDSSAPNNVLDFYEAIKHVASNTAALGVDPARICMAGESGGGYICAGAMVQLALREEAGLVKLAVPVIPMLDDYEFTSKLSMTSEEAENAVMMQKIWHCIGGPDFEAKRNTPEMFPAKASAELLAKMPPTIVWEAEFDMYITVATR